MNNKSDLKILSQALDSKFSIGSFRFGYDGLIGLVPVIGDTITMCLSMYIVVRAIFMRYPTSIIIKMFINVLVENIISIIPLFGNIFDFIWKSNLKNIRLLEAFDSYPKATIRSTKLQLFILFFSIIGIFIFSIYLIIKLTIFIFGLII